MWKPSIRLSVDIGDNVVHRPADSDKVGYLLSASDVVKGPNGRGSGWACDVRKTFPYSIYSELEFDEVVRSEGDAMARFKVRMDEMVQSARIIAQLIDNIPEGEYCVKVPKVVKLPAGHWFKMVEGCRGTFGIYLESDGSASPYRLKIVRQTLVRSKCCRGMSCAHRMPSLSHVR